MRSINNSILRCVKVQTMRYFKRICIPDHNQDKVMNMDLDQDLISQEPGKDLMYL